MDASPTPARVIYFGSFLVASALFPLGAGWLGFLAPWPSEAVVFFLTFVAGALGAGYAWLCCCKQSFETTASLTRRAMFFLVPFLVAYWSLWGIFTHVPDGYETRVVGSWALSELAQEYLALEAIPLPISKLLADMENNPELVFETTSLMFVRVALFGCWLGQCALLLFVWSALSFLFLRAPSLNSPFPPPGTPGTMPTDSMRSESDTNSQATTSFSDISTRAEKNEVRQSSRFQQGERIGPYVLRQFLGRGEFGEVWLGERTGSLASTQLALKLPLPHALDLANLKAEATVWGRVSNHPNVLPLFEAEVYEGQAVLVSQYVADGSLAAWLKRAGEKGVPIPTAISWTMGILTGLQHLHDNDVIHRDLKPANVLLHAGVPRLADFGLARVLNSTTQSQHVAGTPVYMAPEAFQGTRSIQTDLWAVGVILHYLLARALPFPGRDLPSVYAAILQNDLPPLPIEIPQSLHKIRDRALQKSPSDRYASAGEMKRDFAAANSFPHAPGNS